MKNGPEVYVFSILNVPARLRRCCETLLLFFIFFSSGEETKPH